MEINTDKELRSALYQFDAWEEAAFIVHQRANRMLDEDERVAWQTVLREITDWRNQLIEEIQRAEEEKLAEQREHQQELREDR